jgi:hypothetical protein
MAFSALADAVVEAVESRKVNLPPTKVVEMKKQ